MPEPTDPSSDPRDGSADAALPSGDAPPPSGDAAPPSGADLARRRFFRSFAGELMTGAATIVGAAQAIQRSSAEVAQTLLGGEPSSRSDGLPAADPPAASAGSTGAAGSAWPPSAPWPQSAPPAAVYRSAFRWQGDTISVVDQSRLPGAIVETSLESADDVVAAIRRGTIVGPEAMAQLGAIGLALSANARRDAPPGDRPVAFGVMTSSLANARPSARSIRSANARMLGRLAALPGGASGPNGDAVADALRAEAEAIVFDATDAHGRLVEVGLGALPAPAVGPLQVLVHGASGALACGQSGTALGIVLAAHHADRPIHAWVPEARPTFLGSRITAWELENAGVSHTLVVDAAAGSLLAAGAVDAVLLAGEWVAADGDVVAEIGGFGVAALAARLRIPVLACAPLSAFEPDGLAGDVPLGAYDGADVVLPLGRRVAPEGTPAHSPAVEVVPAELVDAIVTEEGILRAPFGPAITAALTRGRARRVPPPAYPGLVPDADRAMAGR